MLYSRSDQNPPPDLSVAHPIYFYTLNIAHDDVWKLNRSCCLMLLAVCRCLYTIILLVGDEGGAFDCRKMGWHKCEGPCLDLDKAHDVLIWHHLPDIDPIYQIRTNGCGLLNGKRFFPDVSGIYTYLLVGARLNVNTCGTQQQNIE